MKKSLLSLLLAAAALPLRAQTNTPPPPAPLAGATPEAASAAPNPITFFGSLDAYYGYDFGNDATNFRPNFLYSYNRQNEFSVNQALLGVRYNDDHVRGTLSLQAGSYVDANYANEDVSIRHLYEAYAGFRPFKKAWLDAGIFTSHIGFESAIGKDNWTLTRSIMAENSPYYEAGARFTYEADSTLTLTALVLNGWQNIRETNENKALGTQIQWKPSPKLLLNSSTFVGVEGPTGTAQYRRYFHDFYLTYALTERLSVAGVFDVGKQETEVYGKYNTWHAGAAFVRYKLAERWSATGRAEYFYAERGVVIRGISPSPGDADFRAGGGSLNLDYAPAARVLLRLEGRYLRGRAPVFQRIDNPAANSYGNITSSLAISF